MNIGAVFVVILGLITLILGKVTLDLASKEIQGRLDMVCFLVLKWARRRLPSGMRERLHDREWLPELQYILEREEVRPVTRLAQGLSYAVGLFFAAKRTARAADAPMFRRGILTVLLPHGNRIRRHLALITLVDELRRDAAILDDRQYAMSKENPRPRVYPRLPVSATDAALTSGALAKRSDNELLRLLHSWRDEANGFNRRLELTEILIFTSENSAEIAEFERALHRSDGYFNQIRQHLRELQDYLAKSY